MSLRRRFHRRKSLRKRSHRSRYLSEGGFTGRSSGSGLTDKDVS
jgi:hypothetical protein